MESERPRKNMGPFLFYILLSLGSKQVLDFYLLIFKNFGWYWGLNSGPCALEPYF
jgi:hypothetical protein